MNYYNKKILPRSKQLFKEQIIPKTGEMEDNEETDHSGFQQIHLLRKEKSNCGGGKKMEITEAMLLVLSKMSLQSFLHRPGWGLPGVQVMFALAEEPTDWRGAF